MTCVHPKGARRPGAQQQQQQLWEGQTSFFQTFCFPVPSGASPARQQHHAAGSRPTKTFLILTDPTTPTNRPNQLLTARSRREPVDLEENAEGGGPPAGGRDVFNEKPSLEDIMAAEGERYSGSTLYRMYCMDTAVQERYIAWCSCARAVHCLVAVWQQCAARGCHRSRYGCHSAGLVVGMHLCGCAQVVGSLNLVPAVMLCACYVQEHAPWYRLINVRHNRVIAGVPCRQLGAHCGVSCAATADAPAAVLPRGVVVHTTRGDITLKLFPDECPKTVENFTTHAKNGCADCAKGCFMKGCGLFMQHHAGQPLTWHCLLALLRCLDVF